MKPQWSYLIGFVFCMGAAALSTEVYKVGGPNARMVTYALGLLGFTSSAIFAMTPSSPPFLTV